MPAYNRVKGDGWLSDLSSATTLSSIPATTTLTRVQAVGGNVRFRYNVAPTATAGGVIYQGTWHEFPYNATDIALFQFIEETSGAKAFAIFEG